MKPKTQYKKIVLLLLVILLAACSKESPLGESQLDLSSPSMSDLDKWIDANYTTPYNIKVQYKWDQNMVDQNLFLYPPIQDKVQPVLEIIHKIWIESYTTAGGPDFIKKFAPKEFVLIGGFNVDSEGNLKLGIAEGGQRITLFQTDGVDKKNLSSVKAFAKIVQHEYVHILNQHKPFDEDTFSKITPKGYLSNWGESEDPEARELGFITAYARANIMEDFAETASVILLNTKAQYAAILARIKSTQAKADIQAKEALVVKYYKDAFNIDFYKLRDEAEKNTNAVVN